MYYPEQRFVSELANIRRQAMLPEVAIGNIQVKENQMVDVRDTVARGIVPSRHIIINASDELNVNPEQLQELLLVNLGARVEEGQAIAGRHAERGRRVFAPTSGVIIAADGGRIIMQQIPDIIRLDAGVRGRVTQIFEGRGVAIEARGAILQGVWGNDKNVISVMRWEPERGGVESINLEELDTTYKNEIVIRRSPITAEVLEIGMARGFSGLIAPSMPASLLDAALNVNFAIMLTEGFGEMNMSSSITHLLSQFNGGQGMLDAAQPQRFAERSAELVINRPVSGNVQDLTKASPIQEDVRVRITRAPHRGAVGTVVELPSHPILLDNGLRVKCAVVELLAGDFVDVPLANLELAGT